VTNVAAGLSEQPVDHGEVLAAGQRAATSLGALLASVIPAAG
jgi:purine-nucleoside phosphorylase